jgi:hypothetical protein
VALLPKSLVQHQNAGVLGDQRVQQVRRASGSNAAEHTELPSLCVLAGIACYNNWYSLWHSETETGHMPNLISGSGTVRRCITRASGVAHVQQAGNQHVTQMRRLLASNTQARPGFEVLLGCAEVRQGEGRTECTTT